MFEAIALSISHYLPWLLSVITLGQAWMAGAKHRRAWAVALGNQVLWLLWIVCAQAWGFLPMTAGLTFVFWVNHRRWTRG